MLTKRAALAAEAIVAIDDLRIEAACGRLRVACHPDVPDAAFAQYLGDSIQLVFDALVALYEGEGGTIQELRKAAALRELTAQRLLHTSH